MELVFDLGGVVVTWDPRAIVASVFDDPHEQTLVLDGLFAHPDWVELDRGSLSPEEASTRAASRTGIAAARLRTLLAAMPRTMLPMPASLALVRDLRNAGHRLFVLSNQHRTSLAYLQDTTTSSLFSTDGSSPARLAAASPRPPSTTACWKSSRLTLPRRCSSMICKRTWTPPLCMASGRSDSPARSLAAHNCRRWGASNEQADRAPPRETGTELRGATARPPELRAPEAVRTKCVVGLLS